MLMICTGECKHRHRFGMTCWLIEVMSLLAWISLSYLSAQNKWSCPFSSGSTTRRSLSSRLFSVLWSCPPPCPCPFHFSLIIWLAMGTDGVALPLYENMTPSCQGSVPINRRHGGGATKLEIRIFRLHFDVGSEVTLLLDLLLPKVMGTISLSLSLSLSPSLFLTFPSSAGFIDVDLLLKLSLPIPRQRGQSLNQLKITSPISSSRKSDSALSGALQ